MAKCALCKKRMPESQLIGRLCSRCDHIQGDVLADLQAEFGATQGGADLLKASLAPAEEFSVMVHELAHEMLHQDPANRPKDKTVREAEAEAVAYVVCQGIGLDANTTSSDYIQLYNGNKKTLLASLERIQRAAAEILEAVTAEGRDGTNGPDGSVDVAVAA
jgi:hypothetical protein